jgi:hypothetical protein
MWGADRTPYKQREVYIMTKKPMPKSESESYAGQPQSTPMPEYPIPRVAVPAMPMPTRMPVQDTSSYASSQRPTTEEAKVIAMDDYPAGHGGMRMVPMPRAEQPVQPAVRPDAPIGTKPPAIKMPTNP